MLIRIYFDINTPSQYYLKMLRNQGGFRQIFFFLMYMIFCKFKVLILICQCDNKEFLNY